MYELFQFVRTFSLKTSKPANHNGSVEFKRFAWRDEGEKSFLALLCSNDYLLLRYNVTGHLTVTRQLPWPPEEQIIAMSFDPSLTWLLVVTNNLYIIPALSLVDPNANVDQLFAIDDITTREFVHTRDTVTCAVWWQTLDGRQIGVLGTKTGEILFVDLLGTAQTVKRIENVNVTDLALSHDDLLMNTSLLITSKTGNQWHLLLETRTTIQGFAPDADTSELGYDNIDGRTIPPRSILDYAEGTSDIFTPHQFTDFQPPTHFQPQIAKGRHFITVHSSSTSTLNVLESSAGHNELFRYRLPIDADNVILTDRLIFTTIDHSRERKLIALSNQLSEWFDKKQDSKFQAHRALFAQAFEKGLNPKAVMQEFLLPDDEKLLGIEVKRFPFYYHEHQENDHLKQIREGGIIQPSRNHNVPLKSDVLEIPITRHTVLDGCIIITSHSLYEIRPRLSPERLFLHLALMLPETTQAELLAIKIGLDPTSLSELAAEYMLEQGCFPKVMKLYKLSKKLQECPLSKRVGGLARHGCISETTTLLKKELNLSGYDLPSCERKFMSNMLLHCFVYQLHGAKRPCTGLKPAFKDFLSSFFSFDEQMALNLLSDFKEVDLLLSLAKSRGLIVDALNLLGKAEAYGDIPYSSLSDLVKKGFITHLIHSGNLVPCLSPENLAKLLITRPQLAIQHCNVLKPLLPSLKPDFLLELARIYDPSKSVMKGVLKRAHSLRRRTNSLTSLSSFASEAVDLSGERETQSDTLLELFLTIVLYLNKYRRGDNQDHTSIAFESMVADPMEAIEQDEENQSMATDSYTHLSVQIQLIACGPKHAAAVRNGDLYTWGRALQGRLGHGDVPQTVCPPRLVETLHMLKLTVQAVACGNEHTLALTNQGVYGWGNSKYGQVGVGKTFLYCRPMFIETLQTENVVAITCGFYHSMALTMDHQVYTWGWGVHGQLGQGDPEDYLFPCHVRSLLSSNVVQISAGYAHSLALGEDGHVWSFGCGYFGQLGSGSSMKSLLPKKIRDIPDPVSTVGTKYFHSAAVTTTNKVYIWGSHPHSLRQLASSVRQARHGGRQISDPNSFQVPCLVDTTFVHGKIIKVACGSLHTVLVTEDGGVYIWGRNLEGQLGTGSRQDERLPKMLTSLNHQHILTAESGGEYTLAMDAEATIWLWGKNDSGQLSYSRMRKDTHANKARSALSGQGSEFMTPTCMRSLPASDPGNQTWMGLLSSMSQRITEDDIQEEVADSYVGHMPNLDLLGPVAYPSTVVPVTLKVFETLLDPSFALQKSVDLKDWICAAQISCLQEDYIQALYYRLQVVSERLNHCPNEEIMAVGGQLVAHHIDLILSKPLHCTVKNRELHTLCEQALEFWQKYNLPVKELERLFSLHISILSPWLLKVVLRPSTQNEDKSVSTLTFSSQFSLQVLKLCMQPSAILSGPEAIDFSSLLDSKDGGQPDLRPREKLDPRDRLWSYILSNMKKDAGPIYMSQSQIQRMEEDATQNGGSQKFIVFSCGHTYQENVYQDTVASLTSNLSIGPNKLPQSSMLLQQLLSKSGLKASACPKCIKQGLHAS